MDDTEMLRKVLEVYVQPLTGPDEKTVGEWRREVGAVLQSALEHWGATHHDIPIRAER